MSKFKRLIFGSAIFGSDNSRISLYLSYFPIDPPDSLWLKCEMVDAKQEVKTQDPKAKSIPKDAGKSSKPVLRSLLVAKTKKDFAIAMGVGLTAALSYFFLVKCERRKMFAEFHKTFDVDAAYERMKSKGLFQLKNHNEE